jgi:HEAT repeat protein
MGNLLLDAYIDDLKAPAADKKISAARELANMGMNAKKAVPALERMAAEKDKKVSEAAKRALASIRK